MLFVNMIFAGYRRFIQFICNDIKFDDVVRFKCHYPAVLIAWRVDRLQVADLRFEDFQKSPSSTVSALEDHLLVQFEFYWN